MKFGILFSLILALSTPVWATDMEDDAKARAELTTAKATALEDSQPIAAQSAEKVKSEDAIPVDFSKLKKTEATEASSGRLFLTFGIMAVILGLGYYFAKKYGRPTNTAQTKIKILTQHYLGPKRSLAIVRVAGESILIGITDQNINMIKSLSLLDDEVPENVTATSFQETFNEKKEMTMGQLSTGPNASRDTSKEGNEEFSIRHIKDVVSLKLKGMRRDV